MGEISGHVRVSGVAIARRLLVDSYSDTVETAVAARRFLSPRPPPSSSGTHTAGRTFVNTRTGISPNRRSNVRVDCPAIQVGTSGSIRRRRSRGNNAEDCPVRLDSLDCAAATSEHPLAGLRSRLRAQSLSVRRDSLRSSRWLPTSSPYGLRRWRSRGNNTASRILSRSSIVITSRSPPSPQPACGGIPYLNIFV